MICHLASSRLIYYITWSPIKLLLQATFAFYLCFIFSSTGHVPINKENEEGVILISKSNQGNTKGILFLVNLIQKPLLVSTYNFGFLFDLFIFSFFYQQ